MGELKAKLRLNGGEEILDLKGREDVSRKLFDALFDASNYFELNDDGQRFELKDRLAPFCTSSEEESVWRFAVTDESRDSILELFSKLEDAPHVRWKLCGEDFSVEYFECGQSEADDDIVECFTIMAGGKTLEKIDDIVYAK